MTINQALKAANRVYIYFACANGANIDLRVTKAQVREMAGGEASLGQVFTHIDEDVDHEPTARWSLSADSLHLHFLT